MLVQIEKNPHKKKRNEKARNSESERDEKKGNNDGGY